MGSVIMFKSGFAATLDPCNRFTHVSDDDLVNVAGYLPTFINPHDPRTLKEQCKENYGFPLSELEGGEVDEEGIYRYPEDPALHPVMRISHNGEKMLIYQYGITAFVKDGESWVCRMD